MKTYSEKIQLKSGYIESDRKRLAYWRQNAKSGTYELRIEPWEQGKTRRQNNYYWMLCDKLGFFLGYSKREISDQFLIMNNFTEKRRDFQGRVYIMPMSFAELNFEQVKDLINESINFIKNNWHDFKIPDPEEYKNAATNA